MAAYSCGLIIVAVDNASIHTSRMVQKWLSQQPRLQLVFLPKYIAADLKPVDKVWWRLKAVIAANRCFKNLDQLTDKAHHFFRDLTPPDTLRLVAAHRLTEHLERTLAA